MSGSATRDEHEARDGHRHRQRHYDKYDDSNEKVSKSEIRELRKSRERTDDHTTPREPRPSHRDSKRDKQSHRHRHRSSSVNRGEVDEGDDRREKRNKDKPKKRRKRSNSDEEDQISHRERQKKSHRHHDRRRHHDSGSESEEKKGRKRKREKKIEKKKKHRKHDDDSEKRSLDNRIHAGSKLLLDKKLLVPLGDISGKPPDNLLDVDRDYFSRHQEFWVYLFREEGTTFNDLTSEESRKAFERFVIKYNAGELENSYYDPKGLPQAAVEEAKTTRHSWSFQTTDKEEQSLYALQEGVRKQTDYHAPENKATDSSHFPSRGGVTLASMPRADEKKQRTDDNRYADRVVNRRLRDSARTVEEELTGGKKEGRERQIEKRKELSARIHGAAKDREDAVGVELADDAIYGVDDQREFQTALAREKKLKAQREEQRQSRLSELQEKESNKQADMLKMLGLTGIKPGDKIKIAPRNDN